MKILLGDGKSSTLKMEWLGLACAYTWFFSSMINYYEPFFSGTWTVLLFMLLLCVGLAGTALLWEKCPMLMDGLLPVLTIAGAGCTVLIPFVSQLPAVILFWLSALLMTPLLCRRLYGVLMMTRENARMRTYISAVSATIVLQMIWAMLPLPFIVKFPVLSVFALAGLLKTSAHLPEFKREELPVTFSLKAPIQILRIVAIFLLLILLNLFNTLIHTHVLNSSLGDSDLFSLIVWAIVPLSFLFFAFFSDYKRERLGFILGMLLIFIGCFVALTPNGSVLTAPLLITGEFGGTVTEYCFLTMPLLFLGYSKRPHLVAVSGLIAHTLLSSVISWTSDAWLPQSLLQAQIGRPLILFGAVCVVALIPLAILVWRQHEDATLISALLCLKKRTEECEESQQLLTEGVLPIGDGLEASAENREWTHSLDFLESEHRIALLLFEGLSRTEISERLGMSAAKVSDHLRNIRVKLGEQLPVGHSPYVLKAARRYGLTSRETEVFNELILGRSNTEISANLHIEDSTIKTHVNKIMKKTGMKNRAELISQMRAEKSASISSH